jgi:hypothetical protein
MPKPTSQGQAAVTGIHFETVAQYIPFPPTVMHGYFFGQERRTMIDGWNIPAIYYSLVGDSGRS